MANLYANYQSNNFRAWKSSLMKGNVYLKRLSALYIMMAMLAVPFASRTQDFGEFASALLISVNGGAPAFYNTSGIGGVNQIGSANFSGSLGTFSASNSIVLKGAEVKTWKNGSGNSCVPVLRYRVYKQGDTPGSFQSTQLDQVTPTECDLNTGVFYDGLGPCSAGDLKWKRNDMSVDISGFTAGNYVFEAYFEYTGGYSGGDCSETKTIGSSSTPFSMNFILSATCANDLTISPTSVSPVCQNGTAPTLTATLGTSSGVSAGNITYQWYENSTNSNSGGTAYGSPITTTTATTTTTLTPPVSSPGTKYYYAVVTNTDPTCSGSFTTAAVEVTVNPLPTLTAVAQDATVCSGTNAQINLSGLLPNTTTGVTYNIGGAGTTTVSVAADGSGNGTISIPVTSANNGQNFTVTGLAIAATGCGVSGLSVAVALNVLTPPTSTISPINTAICANASYTLNANQPVSPAVGTWSVVSGPNTGAGQFSDANAYNAVFTPAGGAGTYRLRWTVSNPPCAAASSEVDLLVNAVVVPSVTLAPNPAAFCVGSTAGITATPTNGGSSPVFAWTIDGNAFGGNTASISPTLSAGTYTIAVTVTSNAACATPATASVSLPVTINPLPGAPASGNNSRCGAGAISITATPGANETIDWYSTPSGGTQVLSGNTTYSIGNLATTTTYYAQARNTVTGCISSTRTAVTATINPVPAKPTSAQNNISICGAGTANLTASVGPGAQIDWYTTAVGGTPVLSNSTSYSPSVPLGVTKFYAEASTAAGCVSAERLEFTVTANAIPADPVGTAASRCSTGTVTLTATGAATLRWYNVATGGTVLGSGSSFTTPSISATTTYYVESFNAASNCLSARVPVVATVNPLPAIPTGATGNAVCVSGSMNISATPPSGSTLDWFAAPTGGSALAGGTSTFTTPIISATTTYYAESRDNTTGCVSPTRLAVVATVNAKPSAPGGSAAGTACGTNGTTSLTGTGAGANEVYEWFTAASGGTAFATGATVTSPQLNGNTTVYVQKRNTITNCISDRTAVSIVWAANVTPTATISASSTNICTTAPGGSTPVVFTANITNGGASPTYQWQVGNGSTWNNVGTNAASYTANSLTSPNTVRLILTSNATCATPNPITTTFSTPLTYSTSVPSFGGNDKINGVPNSVCPPASININVDAAGGSPTYYNWTLPSGWTITNGQNTRTVTIAVGSGSPTGNNVSFSVVAGNACGVSGSKSDKTSIGNFLGVDAGADQTICIGSAINLNAVKSGITNTISWSSSPATGSFTSIDITNGTATFTPSANGTYTLTATTNTAAGVCSGSANQASDVMILTVRETPSATWAQPITICEGTSGTLTINNPRTIAETVTYRIGTGSNQTVAVPANGSATINTGTLTTNTTVTLVSAAYSSGPACSATINSTVNVTVSPKATVNAGTPQTVCSNGTITLAGVVSGATNSGTWTAPTGSFDNAALVNAVYTPGKSSGTETLTLTSADPDGAGPCTAVSATVVVTINQAPAITIGALTTPICQGSSFSLSATRSGSATANTWSTNATGGTFSAPNGTTTNYTPAAAFSGSIQFTVVTNDPDGTGPCVADTKTINAIVNPAATINAGTDLTVCQGGTVTLAGVKGGGANAVQWTAPSGSFADATSLTSNYTPSITSGTVTLTLTALDPDDAGPCVAVQDQMIVTVEAAPAITAIGGPDEVCASATPSPIQLSGVTMTGGATGGTWSFLPAGSGTLSNGSFTTNPSGVNFTPAAGFSGDVTLRLTTNSTANCAESYAERTVSVKPAPTVDAGANQTVCSDAAINLTATVDGVVATGGVWTTTGSGTLGTPSALSTTYVPSANDISSGTVTFTFTTNEPADACTAVGDQVVVTIKKAPAITSQPQSEVVCASFPIALSVTATGDALTYQWYKGNPGSGNPVGSGTSTLNFTQAQVSDAGNYYVIVTGGSPCGAVTSNVVTLVVNEQINITQQPVAVTVCEGDAPFKLTTSATAGPDALSYQWYKGTPGSGTIVNDGGNISGATTNELNFANFIPADAGSYYAVISGPPGYVCATTQTNAAVVTIKEKPVVTANPTSQTLCSGDETAIALTSSVSNTTFAWTVNQANGAAGATAGSGPNIAQTLTTGSAVGTVTYTITPTANGCAGNPIDVVVTVNPKPTVTYNPNADFAICSGENANIALTSDLAGTTFNWSVAASGVTGAAAGSGTGTSVSIGDVLAASGTSNGTVTYTITNTTSPGGCTTPSKTIVVTVKPIPTTTITNNKPSFCSHASTDIALSSPVSGTTFAWTAAVTSGTATFTGATSGSGNQITQAIQNPGNTDAVITYTITPTANGCAGIPTTATVTVKPLPIGAIAAQIVGGGQTVCLNGTAPLQLTGSNGTPNYEFFYTVNGANSASVSTTGGSSTINVNAPTNTAGTFVYQLYAIKDANSTEAACPQALNPPQNATIIVKPLPTATITRSVDSTCIGAASPTITFTGAAGVAPYTFTYNINGGSNTTVSGSGSSNTATVNVSTASSGTQIFNLVSVAESSATPACSQPQTGSVAVTVRPDATVTLSSGASSQAVCQGNAITPVVYTVGGSGIGATVSGLPAGLTSTYNPTNKTLTISGTPTASGTFNFTVSTQGPCAKPTTAGTITVDTPPVGGTATPANNLFICQGDQTTVNLIGQSGNIVKWQSSTNGGLTWTDIAETSTSLATGAVNATTWYRAVVSKPGCNAPGQIVNSVRAVVSVVPKTGPGALTVTGAPAVICSGSVTLTASGFGSDSTVGDISGGDFDNAGVELDGPGKWRKTLIANWDSQDKPNIEASTNNTINSAYNLTNGPKAFLTSAPCSTVTYNNNPLGGQPNNTKFMMVVGPNTSSLESPIFNLIGLQTASMDWWEAFILEAGASIKIEISTDGGATYNTTLQTITGPTTRGSTTNFTPTSLNLNDYLGLSNLRIKFTYTGTACSSWGLEAATITKGVAPATFTWNLTDPAPPAGGPPNHHLNAFVTNPAVVTPPPNTSDTIEVYKYSIASSAGGCLSDITVSVNPTPSVTAAAAPGATCGSSTFNFNVGGPVAGTIFSWTRTNTTNLTGVPASGTGNISGTLTNTTNAVQSSTFTITPTFTNGGVSCPGTPITRTITVNPNPTATLAGTFNCNSSQATITITIPTVGAYSGVLVTQGGNVSFSGTNAGPGSAVVTLTPNQTVNSTFTYSLQSFSVNGCPMTTLPNLTLAAAPQAGVTGTWTCGAGDGDWFNPCNWANGIVPTLDIDVIIPAGTCNARIDPSTSTYASGPTAIAYARNITINGQGIEMPSTSSQLHVAGNWTNNRGTSGFSAGNGTVSFVGNPTNTPNCNPQTINTVGASETFNNLVINNTCNRDGTGDNVVLNKPVNVGGVLTLNDGIVKTTDANILNVTNCALGAVVGGGANTYVNGPMTRSTCSTGDYTFPIGNPNGPYGPYRPAIVQPQDGTPNIYRAEYKLNTITNTGLSGNTLGVVITEHWDIRPIQNCAQSASIGLYYINPNNNTHWGPSGLGVPPCISCNVAIVKAPPANGFWDFTGTGNFSSTRPEYRFWTDAIGLIWGKPINNICTNNIWSFGFSLNTILPIKLVTFEGRQEGQFSKLNWSVADNNEVNFFDLQHSTDGVNFKDLARIQQGSTAFYEYLHRNPARGANYYRLFMKSKDGSEALSRVVVVTHELPVTIITGLKYTLSRGNLQVGVISALNQKMVVSVVDASGRVMWTEKVSIMTGDNTVPLSTSFLAQGFYFVVAQTEDGVRKSMKFMRE